MLRTEGNGHRHTPSVQHSCGAPEGARSRKPRPVLCLGNRALNGRPTGDAEVGVARCPVTERLVGSDAVVDVAEAAVSIAGAPPSSMGAIVSPVRSRPETLPVILRH